MNQMTPTDYDHWIEYDKDEELTKFKNLDKTPYRIQYSPNGKITSLRTSEGYSQWIDYDKFRYFIY